MAAIRSAEIISVGSELATGETRDTNSGDLARDLSARGVAVLRLTALPDRLEPVTEALVEALARVDLVVTTGGLGPTPDDLTREAIAAALGERPAVDAELAAHLESLFLRRGLTMPGINVKQAWLIPSAEALANPHGSAPGWWVERDGRVLIALPGPPAEMLPMWREEALPRLEGRGLGDGRVVRLLRTTGLGESLIVAMLGEGLFRQANPEVATYSRAEAVDIRITARPQGDTPAAELAADVERHIEDALAGHVFGRGDDDWRTAIGGALAGRRLATVEAGSGGQLAALLGGTPWLVHAEVLSGAPLSDLAGLAVSARERSGVDVGLALRAAPRRGDTVASVVIDGGADGRWRGSRVVFLSAEQGRRRAALAACAALWTWLRRPAS